MSFGAACQGGTARCQKLRPEQGICRTEQQRTVAGHQSFVVLPAATDGRVEQQIAFMLAVGKIVYGQDSVCPRSGAGFELNIPLVMVDDQEMAAFWEFLHQLHE